MSAAAFDDVSCVVIINCCLHDGVLTLFLASSVYYFNLFAAKESPACQVRPEC
jgi:hypothetical protein